LTLILIAASGEPSVNLAGPLKHGGYRVEVCTPEDLAREVQTQTPDLVIIQADSGRAPEMMRQVKSAAKDTPVIMALPDFSEAAAARALEAGADEYLFPPFLGPEVLARVSVVLRLARDRRLLVSSREEFTRLFQETPQPLFFCDQSGGACKLNPSMRRLLGYIGQDDFLRLPQTLEELFYGPKDLALFKEQMEKTGDVSHVKLRLRSREGLMVPVLLRDLAPGAPPEAVGFQVQPVGQLSPLKKALQGLVEHFIPSARDWLALLQLTPLLGGRYEKVKKLGQGSFGEVWLVVDTEALGQERHYVAKIPLSRAANAKFRKEATICQRLAPHPGVVRLVNTVEDEGKLILIQEYVDGQTLDELLGEELPRSLVERIILQLIDVVAHAHRNRIIHRDVKPNNIILKPDGTLKLLDFGAAKILREKEISATVVGSRPFMAPEQIMGKSERRSDIWAIGVLMYLLYTGELPFYSEVEKILIDLILEQEPVPPREINPEIPPALEVIILKCLKKDVDERYNNAIALRDDLLRQFPHYGTATGRWPWIQ
jgi:DNA-binding response OmpR family regulator